MDTYRTFFQSLPASLWVFDFSTIKRLFEESESIPRDTNLYDYLQNNQEEINRILGLVRIVDVNAHTLDLYEASSQEELEKNLEKIIPPVAVSSLIDITLALLRGESSYRTSTINHTLGGNIIHLQIQMTVPEEHREQLDRVVLLAQDITNEREMQDEMTLLSIMPQHNPDMVLIMECYNRIVYANPAVRNWLMAHEMHNLEAIHVLLPELFEQSVCRLCDKFHVKEFKSSYGEERFDIKLKPIPGQNRCLITIVDITEIDRISREREVFYKALQASRHGMVITDLDGKIEYINPKFEALYGYSLEEAKGNTPNIINPGRETYYDLGYSDEQYNNIFSDLWKSIRDPAVGYWEGVIPNRDREGNIIWVHLIIHTIYDEQGKPSGYLGMPVDISDQRKREQKIRLDIYQTITQMAEMRDNETGAHIQRVGAYAHIIADEIGMSTQFKHDLLLFAPPARHRQSRNKRQDSPGRAQTYAGGVRDHEGAYDHGLQPASGQGIHGDGGRHCLRAS
ncbi:MAG: PAS domain S-box protein [Spirochaetales bacterium]|nr:PAS domain S-box protein [Spirochaetales bacterium]MCF7939539.1 PAS domain S-box protein [Spirochaetales bacterium]